MNSSNMFTKKCMYCGEDIRADARRCNFCGSLVGVKVDEVKINPVIPMEEPAGLQLENMEMPKEDSSVLKTDAGNENIPIDHTELQTENTDATEVMENEAAVPGDDGKIEIEAKPPLSAQPPRMQNIYHGSAPGPTGWNASNVKPVRKTGNNLSNALKVTLTVIATAVPGLGQLAGIILAIVYMNSEDNADKRSFGLALLIASLVMFVLSCLVACLIAASISQLTEFYGYPY